MKIYAIVGEAAQTIDERIEPICPNGYIEMKGHRPDGEHWLAAADGNWVQSVGLAKEAKLAELAQNRWDVQSAGVRLTGKGSLAANIKGAIFASSQAELLQLKSTLEDAQMLAELEGLSGADIDNYALTFKAANGFYEATIAQLKQARLAIVKHTQECFTVEQKHQQAINALGTVEDVLDYNLLTSWPV